MFSYRYVRISVALDFQSSTKMKYKKANFMPRQMYKVDNQRTHNIRDLTPPTGKTKGKKVMSKAKLPN